MRKLRTWREYLIEQLAGDWDAALDYIQFALEEYQVDKNAPVFMLALRTFVASQGDIDALSKRTDVDAEVLSKVLASEETPPFDMLATILTALGCRLAIEPSKHEEMSTDIELTRDAEIPKFENTQTQLAESDSTQ